MDKTLGVLNGLVEEGVISRYAIGGVIAAVYYVEPLSTFDLDIFLSFAPGDGGLITLSPLYDTLARKGYRASEPHVEIEGILVQFLPAYNPLVEEALAQALDIVYGSTPTRVLRAEHLIAIALQTGRPKDRARVAMLAEVAGLDHHLLDDVLVRFGLYGTWEAWTR